MMFYSLDENVGGYSDIIFGGNSRGKVKGVGTIPISSNHSLSNVLLVDSLKFNLLAVTQLCDFGYKCSFTKDDVVVTRLHMSCSLEESQIYHILECLVANAIFSRRELGYQSFKANVMRVFFLDIHLIARLIGSTTKHMALLKKHMMLSLMKPMGLIMNKKILMM